MNKLFTLIAVFILLASCQQQKIAYVNNSVLINDTDERKNLDKRYEGKDELFKKKTDSISKAFQLEAQQAQITAQRSSKSKVDELMNGLEQKRQVLQQQIQFEQQQLSQLYQTDLDSLIVRLKDFVKGYAKKNGYSYILGTSDATSSVMFGKEENDLTEVILEELNKSYKDKE